MRRSAIALVAVLAIGAPAFAGGPPAAETVQKIAKRPGFVRRSATAVGGFFSKHFGTRIEVKEAALMSQALREQGDLVGSAKAITGAPKAQNMFERFRLGRQQKTLFKDAKANLTAKFGDARPAEGKAALKELGSAGKLSFLNRWSAGIALVRSGKNAQRTARSLGKAGRFDQALPLLEYARGERGHDDRGVLKTSQRLYKQSMKAAERSAKQVGKAARSGDRETAQAAYEAAIDQLEQAARFGEMRDGSGNGGKKTFDENRARLVAARMGTTLEEINTELTRRAQKQSASSADSANGG